MRTLASVGLFGALGAMTRYGIDVGVARAFPGRFPLSTFLVNIGGSFALGLILGLVAEGSLDAPAWVRTGLTVGLLGAFTTFSTLSLQTVLMLDRGAVPLAIGYVALSLAVGLVAGWGGLLLGRSI